MSRKTLSPIEKAHWEATAQGHDDAQDSLSTCPLMGDKVQLLPLRYGRVERLSSPTDSEIYEQLQRPIGLRLLRDGYLYVIDETSGYLHEYRIQNGVPVKLLWQDREVNQDVRQTSTGETALIFPRESVLYIAYAELQWTAAKCSHVLGSAADRAHFMQHVSLAEPHCQTGGVHLRVEKQVLEQLAELAEQPAATCPSPDIPEEEQQDYIWEDQPLFREAHIGELKNAINPFYEKNHLYLVVQDSIGILRDLAEEQDRVVTWIEQWRNRTDNDLRYPIASYIDTLIKVGDHTTRQQNGESKLVEKTTPEQRTWIYDYVDARNTWRLHRNQGPVPVIPVPGQPQPLPSDSYEESPATKGARQEMERRKAQMIEALGKPLHDELEDDIEALEKRSTGALEGVGLGSRGIHDLVRVEEMQRYLSRERLHLKRWTARLDAITEDRISLFEQGEFHRSAWYFDPEHPDQLKNALAMEFNCTRDIARTEACMERLGRYFHNNPHFILPVFYGRLNLSFLQSKSGDLIKWLDDFTNFPKALAETQQRINEVIHIMGNHWTNGLNLTPEAQAAHQAVNATYIPSVALDMDNWLAKMQQLLNTPQLRRHLDTFSTFTNRAQRLGMLSALQVEGATLSIANQTDVENFKTLLARFNQLLGKEDQLIRDRDQLTKQLRRHGHSPQQRQDLMYEKQAINQMLLNARNDRAALRRQLEAGITPTSNSPAGFIGVRLNLTPPQQAAFDDEIRRFKAGLSKGYDTAGSRMAGFKAGLMPLLVTGLMAGNLIDARAAWQQSDRSVKERVVIFGAIASVTSALLSVCQSVAISITNEALQATIASTSGKSGRLFQLRIGQIGLALGGFVSALSLVGAAGTSVANWSKWQEAFISGTSGEKAGAFMGLTGDTGTLTIATVQAFKAGSEVIGLIREIRGASDWMKARVASYAWTTRGARFLAFSARLTPISLAFTALQLGGEALYNYSSLDDQQRWLLCCVWGLEAQGWDWSTHAQRLAEATLVPTVVDRGTHRQTVLSEPVRSLHLVLPGITAAMLEENSLLWAAIWHNADVKKDVTEALSGLISIAATAPLTIELKIAPDWQGHHNILHLRLAAKPSIAHQHLKADQGHLYYRISLAQDLISNPIRPSFPLPESLNSIPLLPITKDSFQ
ncbi:hypothetical protein EGJ27_14955 [Pseudomonas sp. v388]|uniref:toxin VasX n=1 Tax=Pseudomonas sp. v388 TaxID=2479849 RepID=UPI000F7B79B8|nr:toxin VasX [Pseudomonas sp. v388]RRV05985.1 hypothetical protein EGJ27_14955 [Pseudomonas sp. v388]